MDANPLILKLDPKKYRMYLTLFTTLFVVGVIMVRGGVQAGWFVVGVFSLGSVAFAVQLVPGCSCLIIEDTGLTIRAFFVSRSYRWEDIASFGTAKISRHKMVVFNFSKSYQGMLTARDISKRFAGYEGALPDTYGMSAENLSAMLNQKKAQAGL